MKCDEAGPLLIGMADGAIDAGEAESVRGHLAACEGCRGLLERLQADAELLRREPAPEAPAGLATRIMAEVRARERRAGRWSGLSPALARVAAVVLVVLGVWLGAELGRGMLGSQPSLDQQLAAYGVRAVEPGR